MDETHCIPCRGGIEPLTHEEALVHLEGLPQWTLSGDAKAITRAFAFRNFAQALALVNQIGAIAEAENHHPDIAFGWGYVKVTFTTHATEGLHENDFVMARKVDALEV